MEEKEENENPRRRVRRFSYLDDKEENYDPRIPRIEPLPQPQVKAEAKETSSLDEKEENYNPRRPHIEPLPQPQVKAEAKETSSLVENIPEFFLRRSGSIFAFFMSKHERRKLSEYGTTVLERMNKLRKTAYDYYIKQGIPEDTLHEFLVAFIYTYISLTHLDETSTGQMVAEFFGKFKPDADIGEFKRSRVTGKVKPDTRRTPEFTNFLNTVEAYALQMAEADGLQQEFSEIHGGKNKKNKINKKSKKNKSKRRKNKKTRKTKSRKNKPKRS
jgi:hypothetical protein